MKQHISTSAEQTKQIARDFAGSLKGGEVVALEGELGAGKTTFVQGMAEYFGVEDPVRSPTYTVMNIYSTNHDQIDRLIHIDLYRLESGFEMLDIDLEAEVDDKRTIVVIEWPKWTEKLLADKHEIKNVKLEVLGEGKRRVEVG